MAAQGAPESTAWLGSRGPPWLPRELSIDTGSPLPLRVTSECSCVSPLVGGSGLWAGLSKCPLHYRKFKSWQQQAQEKQERTHPTVAEAGAGRTKFQQVLKRIFQASLLFPEEYMCFMGAATKAGEI